MGTTSVQITIPRKWPFFVDDAYQGKGIGTILLEHLADNGWREGFQKFVAYVLRDNDQMQKVFRSSGFDVSQVWQDGFLQLTLPLHQTERQRSLALNREKLATAASLKPFFEPATVAVVGASRDSGNLGHHVLQHIIEATFSGTVYPVNLKAESVYAIRAYPRLSDVPDTIDLAVVVVPKAELLSVVNDAIYANVRAMVIASSGLSDRNEEGRRLEETLVAKLRRAGIRLIGPSSMGLVNTDQEFSLNASLSEALPQRGDLAVASHSGALGIAIMNYAHRMGLGISSFVSLGNKPDVSVNDMLQYWQDDPQTRVIMLYMESFGNPRKFSQIARQVTRQKPILAVKSARTTENHRFTSTRHVHWDMIDAPVEAMFRQSGIIRADSLGELFDVAAILTTQPLPKGNRIALITNSAAGTVVVKDAMDKLGLILLQTVDVGFGDLAHRYRRTMARMLATSDIDVLVIVFVPVGDVETESVLRAIRAEVARYTRTTEEPITIVANLLLADPTAARMIDAGRSRIPVFPFPENAFRALARVRAYAEYLEQPLGQVPDLPDANVLRARELLRHWMASHHDGPLSQESAFKLFEVMGIPLTVDRGKRKSSMALAIVFDRLFGPVLGLRMNDGEVRIRLVPVTDQDADRLIPKEWHPVHRERLRQLVLGVSRLIEECPEVRSIELGAISFSRDRVFVAEVVLEVSASGYQVP